MSSLDSLIREHGGDVYLAARRLMLENSTLWLKLAEADLYRTSMEDRIKNAQSMVNLYIEQQQKTAAQLYDLGFLISQEGDIIPRVVPDSKKFTGEILPVTLWFRIVPDDDGKDTHEFNHFEEGHVDSSLPTPRPAPHAIVFKGRWSSQFAYRTDELCPKIITQPAP